MYAKYSVTMSLSFKTKKDPNNIASDRLLILVPARSHSSTISEEVADDRWIVWETHAKFLLARISGGDRSRRTALCYRDFRSSPKQGSRRFHPGSLLVSCSSVLP